MDTSTDNRVNQKYIIYFLTFVLLVVLMGMIGGKNSGPAPKDWDTLRTKSDVHDTLISSYIDCRTSGQDRVPCFKQLDEVAAANNFDKDIALTAIMEIQTLAIAISNHYHKNLPPP